MKKFILILLSFCMLTVSCARFDTGNTQSNVDTDSERSSVLYTSSSDVGQNSDASDKENNSQDIKIKFEDKIIYNLEDGNTVYEDILIPILTFSPFFAENEYGEMNLIYFHQTYSYYVYVEMSKETDDIYVSEAIKKLSSTKTRTIKFDGTHFIFIYKNFEDFKKVQKDGLHMSYNDGSINKVCIGIMDKKDGEFYGKVSVNDTSYNINDTYLPKCDLIKSYNDFEDFLLKYDIELGENKIDENTFEENDILAIGTTGGGYNTGFYDFQIIDGKYFISSSFIENGICTDDQIHHFIDFVIVPKSEKNIKAEDQKIFICNDKIIM